MARRLHACRFPGRQATHLVHLWVSTENTQTHTKHTPVKIGKQQGKSCRVASAVESIRVESIWMPINYSK